MAAGHLVYSPCHEKSWYGTLRSDCGPVSTVLGPQGRAGVHAGAVWGRFGQFWELRKQLLESFRRSKSWPNGTCCSDGSTVFKNSKDPLPFKQQGPQPLYPPHGGGDEFMIFALPAAAAPPHCPKAVAAARPCCRAQQGIFRHAAALAGGLLAQNVVVLARLRLRRGWHSAWRVLGVTMTTWGAGC